MPVDLTIRLGDILTMAGLFAGGIVVVIALRSSIHLLAEQMKTHDMKIAALDSKVDGITSILADIARHDERIRFVEQELREMRRSREYNSA